MHSSDITTQLLRMVEALDDYPARTPNQQLLRDKLYEAYTQGRIAETEDTPEPSDLPEYLTKALTLYEDCAFACGAWTEADGDTETYMRRSDALLDARVAVIAAIQRYHHDS